MSYYIKQYLISFNGSRDDFVTNNFKDNFKTSNNNLFFETKK